MRAWIEKNARVARFCCWEKSASAPPMDAIRSEIHPSDKARDVRASERIRARTAADFHFPSKADARRPAVDEFSRCSYQGLRMQLCSIVRANSTPQREVSFAKEQRERYRHFILRLRPPPTSFAQRRADRATPPTALHPRL